MGPATVSAEPVREIERIVADTEFDVHQLAKRHGVKRCYIKLADSPDTAEMKPIPLANLGMIAAVATNVPVGVYRLDEWTVLMIGWVTQAHARQLSRRVHEAERF